MRMKKSHPLLLRRQTFSFNREYNTWKEKQIEKRRKEESKFVKLDENSEPINTEFWKEAENSISTVKPVIENQKMQANLPGVGAPNEGSSSFVGGQTSNFYMPSAPNKNTTFEMPKASNSG